MSPLPRFTPCLTATLLLLVGVLMAHAERPAGSPEPARSLTPAPSLLSEPARGRHWYVLPPPKEDIPDSQPDAAPPAVPAPPTPRERLKQQGEDWENALAKAILHPSPENYLEYLRQTTAIQAQAQQFALGFKRTIWQAPEYDYTLQAPVRAEAISAKNQAQHHRDVEALTALATRYGLVFFFRSDCPYCQRFAPLLKVFAGRFGFSVLPVSLDHQGLPDFPNPKPNAFLAANLQVKVVPTVFLVDPVQNILIPVSYGYTDASTLTQKILWAAKLIKEQDRPHHAAGPGRRPMMSGCAVFSPSPHVGAAGEPGRRHAPPGLAVALCAVAPTLPAHRRGGVPFLWRFTL